MKILPICLASLILTTGSGLSQIGLTLTSLDWLVARADLAVRAKIDRFERVEESDNYAWLEITLEVEETLKGKAPKQLTFAREVLKTDGSWKLFVKSGQPQLWFLMDSGRPVLGQTPEAAAMHAKHPFKAIDSRARIRLGATVEGEFPATPGPPPIFTMEFELLSTAEEILDATHPRMALFLRGQRSRRGTRAHRRDRLAARAVTRPLPNSCQPRELARFGTACGRAVHRVRLSRGIA